MLGRLLQNVFNALQWGSFYSIIALGYCLVYGVLRLINFAHGDIFMTASYIAFLIATIRLDLLITIGGVQVVVITLMLADKMPVFPVTMILTVVLTALLGITIERVAYRPLRRKGVNRLYVVITALMVGFILENGNLALVGASAKRFPDLIPERIWSLGPVMITNLKVLVILSAFVVFGILQFIVKKTVFGMSMRAISYDKFAIPLMGIPVNRIITFTFALGSALAAVAGILFGMSYPVLSPQMGMILGWKAFIAAVAGGIGDIRGAFLGGFMLGFIEIFIVDFFPSSFKDLVSFLILLIIMVLKPTGFFGVAKSTKI
jgi:branched-chain amino acid transport system permease protein